MLKFPVEGVLTAIVLLSDNLFLVTSNGHRRLLHLLLRRRWFRCFPLQELHDMVLKGHSSSLHFRRNQYRIVIFEQFLLLLYSVLKPVLGLFKPFFDILQLLESILVGKAFGFFHGTILVCTFQESLAGMKGLLKVDQFLGRGLVLFVTELDRLFNRPANQSQRLY
jgi:hypothetical protein